MKSKIHKFLTVQQNNISKNTAILALLLASVCILQSCNRCAKRFTDDQMIEAAKALDAKFIEGMNKEEIDSVMSCYWNDPNIIVYPPDEYELKGWDAAKASYAKFFATIKGAKHELTQANYKVAGDMVLCWGKMRITMSGSDSASTPVVMEGRFTTVVANNDKKWVYIVDHASMALPASSVVPDAPPAPTAPSKQ